MKRFLVIPFVALVVLAWWATQSAVSSNEPRNRIFGVREALTIGDATFITEIADTKEKRQLGLMNRTQMHDEEAMIFIFANEQRVAFWMKNTLIPLDMLFFNSAGELLEIKHQVAPCKIAKCPPYPSKDDTVRYVVELKGGVAKSRDLQIGDKLIREAKSNLQNN